MAAALHSHRPGPTMTTSTLYQWQRLVARFEAYRRTAASLPLADTVQTWLRSLPASQQSAARCALKRHLGPAAVAWDALEVARHHRDEATLLASVLSAKDRAQVRAAAQGPKERALLECLFTARRFEVARLVWGDVDLMLGTVRIRHGKGGRSARTLLTAGAVEALMAWYHEAGRPAPEAPVFAIPTGVGHPKRIGQPYTPGGLGRIVQRILTRAGCWTRGIGCAHRFRRTFATEFLRVNEKDLVGLKHLMRHQQLSTTEKYVMFDPTDLSDRMGRLKL